MIRDDMFKRDTMEIWQQLQIGSVQTSRISATVLHLRELAQAQVIDNNETPRYPNRPLS